MEIIRDSKTTEKENTDTAAEQKATELSKGESFSFKMIEAGGKHLHPYRNNCVSDTTYLIKCKQPASKPVYIM